MKVAPAASKRTARVRCELPLKDVVSDVVRLPNGEVATLSLAWMTRGRWQRRPKSMKAGWQVVPVGNFVIAYRLDA